MTVADLLFSQGFGSRRECVALVHAGRLRIGGRTVDDDAERVAPAALHGLIFNVGGIDWPYRASALLLMHKPVGYECSRKPGAWPSVLSLLPPPLRLRGVQPVGRLDQDTTGVLMLTDDGALLHRLTSPKHHVEKVYQADTAEPVTPAQLARLTAGVVLHDDPQPARAVRAHATGERALELVVTEGRYHQVKRMVAAVGNRVDRLHRSRFGEWMLPPGLAPGQWAWATEAAAADAGR